MFVERPPQKPLIPSWDLNQVLQALTRTPFEPIAHASLMDLSIKTAFLLAVATARRRSELHALSIDPGHLRWEPHGVRLVPHSSFVAKNQSATFQPPDIFVPAIKTVPSVQEDKLWCPVRALKWYLARTKPLRGSTSQLFVSTNRPHAAVSRDTVSRWIVRAIHSANPNWLPDTPVHAHETRAVATSWAFFKGVPLPDILRAAAWKTPSTFVSCYLRDVLQAEGRVGRSVLTAAAPPQAEAQE